MGPSALRRPSLQKQEISGSKLCLLRTLCGFCILVSWLVSLVALPAPLFNHLTPQFNSSNNEILLDKLNLSNYTLSCPQHYVYAEQIQRCQLRCGNYKILFPELNLSKRLFLSTLAVVNVGITLLAIIRWIRIRKQTKFQHHPIIIGVFVNLLQALLIGIPDIIGGGITYCGGRQVDYDSFNNIPSVQVHIIGGLFTFLALSNRLWFTMALVLILVSVSFPFSNLFISAKKKIIIITTELVICFLYPMVSALAPFVPFTGYKLSQEIMIPPPANFIVNIISTSVPHLIISPVTMSLVIVIVYKIRSQMQLVNNNKMKPQSVHPLEKRLMFFSIIYFVLNLIIIASYITKSIRKNSIEQDLNSYLALQTLQSQYSHRNHPTATAALNQTLSLLSPGDQLAIEQTHKPIAVYLNGIVIRLHFILVLSVLNLSCQRPGLCKRRQRGPGGGGGGETIQNPGAKQ